ncbi:acyl-CoA C20 Delta5-desaturase-like isoform X2 [Papaver somniferum]|uniref:acyl-CoA C20 Delta5-desaturase-like isoform X2 n=1 Tax=Papaver somniferum TaxID=3469 RepID=UPI000E702E01|nr:acyl-CoA C20 Delta5-desaturase-like isoform X2 [Papaver somniferum]
MSAEPVYNPKSVVELQQHTKNDQLVLQKIISDYFRDAVNLGAIIVEHIGLLVAPFYFTWDAFWVFWILAFLTNYLGISLCYHKNLSHKSFKLTKSLEYLFAYFGLHAAQGDPVSWVSTHRYHHQFTDSDRDPHSPIEGFWFSHITWLFQHTHLRKKGGKRNNVVDLEKQAYYRFLRRTYPLHIVGLALVLYIGGGLPHLIWGMGVRTALSHHATFVVNSLCHTWGRKPWNTKDLSKNNSVVGLLGHGEGWHNNHHAFEFSARLGLEWWQLDVPWYIIELLEYLGFATDVKVPTEIQKYRMSCKTYNKFHQNEKDFENPWIRAFIW